MTRRTPEQQVVAGVTFGVGSLHQPTEHLGVAGMLAAWLVAKLVRPVEAVDPAFRVDPPRVAFGLRETTSSLMLSGTEPAVTSALQQLDGLLAGGAAGAVGELDDDLRDRSRAYGNALAPWRWHLAARWPGHRPHLAMLGPLALQTLDVAASQAYLADRFAVGPRVYWTNEPRMSELAVARFEPAELDPVAPVGQREQPGCVALRRAVELFTTVLPDTPATQLALSLMARTLHRRMVDFEPLASAVRLSWYDLGGGRLLACGEADLLPGKDAAARSAVVQTLEDLATGSIAAEEIASVRTARATAERTAQLDEPSVLLELAERQVRRGDFSTPELAGDEYAQTTDTRVLQTMADSHQQLLLAVPSQDAATAPFPMAERVQWRPAEGRRFTDRSKAKRFVRCSPGRLGNVEVVNTRGRFGTIKTSPVTLESVDFEEVVLRIDVGEQATVLVDQQLASVELTWDAYRRKDLLRTLVADHLPDVPVIRQPENNERQQQIASTVKRYRRGAVIGFGTMAVVALFVVVAMTIGILQDRPTVTTVPADATVELGNGTTLRIAGEPELIEHYNSSIANVYAVRVRMCGGYVEQRDTADDKGPRNYFGAEKFTLHLGAQTLTLPLTGGDFGIPERPGPLGNYLDKDECATGWLDYRLTGPLRDGQLLLRYSNLDDDEVTWELPARTPVSEISRPCPTPSRDPLGNTVEESWIGCP